jgi:hypothetical protein
MQDLHPSASHLNLDLATFSNLSGKTFDSETRTKHGFPFPKKQYGKLIKDKEKPEQFSRCYRYPVHRLRTDAKVKHFKGNNTCRRNVL